MKKIRSDILKILALIFMLIDHIGAGFVEPLFMKADTYEEAMRLYKFDLILRGIGRLAFPIFCYQLVRGMSYTKNKVKYLRNLFIFALISEPVFDLLFQNSISDMSYQNVGFTLLFGALGIYVYELLRDRLNEKVSGKVFVIVNAIVFTVVFSALSYVAYIFKVDYDAKGIILVAVIYIFRNNIVLLCTVTPVVFMLATLGIGMLSSGNLESALSYAEFEAYSCLSYIFIYRDSGERKGGKVVKWLGYCFYPVHLLIIYLVRIVVLGA